MDKKILFVVYQAPVGAIWVNETFRSTFGMYGEDIEPAILLMDAAVITLCADTCPESLGLLPVKMVRRYINRYETPVYAIKEDVERFKVGNIDPAYGMQALDRASLCEFLHTFDNVIFM
jgi:sulfur relay (sulfurtransferase) DsrF/TusC family protein